MLNFAKRLGVPALIAAGLLAAVPAAHAQFIGRTFASPQYNNPSFVPTQLQASAFRQWAYNTAVVGQTYSQNYAPWLFGYNPYPSPNFGPVYQSGYGGYGGYGGGYSNPYSNPYGGGGYSNPYSSYGGGGYTGGYGGGGYTGGYGGYGSPYAGGYLYGDASLTSATGQYANQLEQARLLREMVNQAKLDTKKKAFDVMAYIRDNTPTFTQEQAKIQKQTLQRIQTMATGPEIWSGKSLNVLLDSLRKQVGKKAPVATASLEEDVLKHLNVTRKHYNLGLLRNNGQFTWPVALRNLATADQRVNIEKEAHRLFRQAVDARVDPESLAALQRDLDQLRDTVRAKVNDTPTSQYLDAQRFLNDFDAAIAGLQDGDAVAYFDFQQRFSGGGKTAQELVDYMIRNGLRFAPAVPGDEAAYQAANSALVAYSVALDNQVAVAKE